MVDFVEEVEVVHGVVEVEDVVHGVVVFEDVELVQGEVVPLA